MEEKQVTTVSVTPEIPKKQYWKDILTTWKTSGEKQALFCRAHGLSRHAFVYWKRQLMPSVHPSKPRLVPLALPRCTTLQESILTIMSEGRYRIEVRGILDPKALRQAVEIMEGIKK